MSNLERFNKKGMNEKLNYLRDDNIFCNKTQSDFFIFIKGIILHRSENSYVKKEALTLLFDHFLLGNIKERQILSLLLDDWQSENDAFLEVQRLKILHLFYEKESSEIESVYETSSINSDLEISSEALYNLGLIFMQKSFFSLDTINFIQNIERSNDFFLQSKNTIENRVDSEFFSLVTAVLLNLVKHQTPLVDQYLSKIPELIFKIVSLSINNLISSFYFGFYRILFSVAKIYSKKPDDWLNFRSDMDELFLYYSEIENELLNERLNKSTISKQFKNIINTKFIVPFFSCNFQSQLSKIELLKKECISEEEKLQFLQNMTNIIRDKNLKKKVENESIKSKMSELFHYIPQSRRDIVISKIDPDDPVSILKCFEELQEYSFQNIFDSLISACIKMQGNRNYRGNFSEDDRNTFIATLLETSKYHVKDQTRWSKSATGKNAGEIDILVYDKKKRPFTIIEALNLDSLDKTYINLHIDKIFNYDSTGLKQNIILIYSNAVYFDKLWEKYCTYIEEYNFVYERTDQIIDEKIYADVRNITTVHNRNGMEVNLHHVMINLL